MTSRVHKTYGKPFNKLRGTYHDIRSSSLPTDRNPRSTANNRMTPLLQSTQSKDALDAPFAEEEEDTDFASNGTQSDQSGEPHGVAAKPQKAGKVDFRKHASENEGASAMKTMKKIDRNRHLRPANNGGKSRKDSKRAIHATDESTEPSDTIIAEGDVDTQSVEEVENVYHVDSFVEYTIDSKGEERVLVRWQGWPKLEDHTWEAVEELRDTSGHEVVRMLKQQLPKLRLAYIKSFKK